MIHHDLLHTIREKRQRGGFLYPAYGEHSIAELPHSIAEALGVDTARPRLPFPLADGWRPKRIVLFFVDGFGFDHLLEHRTDVPFLARLAERANVYPLTSVFPSTTPAALTSVHTGLTPQEHGLPEWTVYFEEFDRIIETFPFRTHLTHGRETLLESGGIPEMLYNGSTIYEALAASGVHPYIFTSNEYAVSAYSRMVQKGATVVPLNNSDELFTKLPEVLREEEGPAYLFAYWSEVDSTEHVFGPRSPEHKASLKRLSDLLEEHLVPLASEPWASDTLFLLSSDHGQSPIAHEDIIYLDDYVSLEEHYYRRSPDSQRIRPTGAPHDVFLFVNRSELDMVLSYLCRELEHKAAVLSVEEAIARGLFGLNEPTERFRRRIGDVLILPYDGYHVWYRHAPGLHFSQRGIHGGLSEREMLVPLAAARLSELA